VTPFAGRYRTFVRVGGKPISLGVFDDPLEARLVRAEWELDNHYKDVPEAEQIGERGTARNHKACTLRRPAGALHKFKRLFRRSVGQTFANLACAGHCWGPAAG
jgi:hypothetical protein